MKTRNAKLVDVRKALPGKLLDVRQSAEFHGGWAPPKWDSRNMYPYIIDTDKP